MYEQISLFDGNEKFIIDKPIRLIELFAGYGSQALSLKYNNMPFEHHKISEWAVKSIQAYKDMHFPNDNTDYSKDLTFDDIIEFLTNKGISANYNEPMTKDQIKRQGEEKCRTIYNNIIATHNLVSVTNVKGKDLDITEIGKNYSDSKIGINLSPTIRAGNNCTYVLFNQTVYKLTPKECFRLMGVKDEDFERVSKNQSNSSLSHLAGDSIVVNVLQAIFNQMRL